MNMQKTITVRKARANSNGKPIGERMTLLRVSNDAANNRVFGFAVTDSGEQVYVPGRLVERYQMTQYDADNGAAFYAPTTDNSRAISDSNSPQKVAVMPLTWDADVEELIIEEPENNNAVDIELEFSALAEMFDDHTVNMIEHIDKAFSDLRNFDLKPAIKRLEKMREDLEQMRRKIDEAAPEQDG